MNQKKVYNRPYKTIEEIPLILTVEEAAEILQVGRTSAYHLISTGEIPCFRVGHKVRIFKEQLLAYMNHPSVKKA